MSVFSCRDLAADWQIAPRTPVLTAVNGQTSLNYDNYSDTEQGNQTSGFTTQYPNIPDHFPEEQSVAAGDSWVDFQTKVQGSIAGGGGVIWLEDGTHNWGAEAGPNLDIGFFVLTTADSPIYVLARNKHQAVVTQGTNTLRCYQPYFIMAGVVEMDFAGQASFFRVSSCLFNGVRTPAAFTYNATEDNKHAEFDNNEYDGGGLNADFGKAIYLLSQASSNDNDHQEHLRVHHNYFHDVIPGVNSNALWWCGIGGPYTGNSTFQFKLIIEANLIDNWQYEKESYEMKCGLYIIRNNVFVNQGEASGQRLRSNGNIQYSGNWCEETNPSPFSSDIFNACVAFNFFHCADSATNRQFSFHTEEDNYGSQDNRLLKHNVTTGCAKVLSATAPQSAPIDFQSGCLLDGNDFYSAFIVNSDAPGNNYYQQADQGFGTNLDETQWRADNDWQSTNTYTLAPLVPTLDNIDPTLFDGTGADIVGDSRFALMYGQPSQIPVPSWWKLP